MLDEVRILFLFLSHRAGHLFPTCPIKWDVLCIQYILFKQDSFFFLFFFPTLFDYFLWFPVAALAFVDDESAN